MEKCIVLFQNVPVGITQKDFLNEILSLLPDPNEKESKVRVKYFKNPPESETRKVIVSEIPISFQEFQWVVKENSFFEQTVYTEIHQGTGFDLFGNVKETNAAIVDTSVFCQHLHFKNLPTGITTKEFIENLKKDFPTELGNQLEKADVIMHTPRGKIQRATVSNVQVNFGQLQAKAQLVKFADYYNYRIFQDKGDPRDEYGDFIHALFPSQAKKEKNISGQITSRACLLFDREFSNRIHASHQKERIVFRNGNTVNLYTGKLGKYVNFQSLSPSGTIKAQNFCANGVVVLTYSSVLDTIQAMALVNGNTSIANPPYKFCDLTATVFCKLNECRGIGASEYYKNEILPTNELIETYGYIPFQCIRKGIFDMDRINNLRSECWRCGTWYQLKGLDIDCRYLVGNCECEYNLAYDVMDENRAYNWGIEKFTRLLVGGKDEKGKENLFIYHPPLRQSYDSAQDYYNRMSVLVQEEFNYQVKELRKNSTVGKCFLSREIENGLGKDGLESLHLMGIRLNKHDQFWGEVAMVSCSSLTINFDMKNENNKGHSWEVESQVKLCKILRRPNNTTEIFVKIQVPTYYSFIMNETVEVVPNPVRSEYLTARKLIRDVLIKPEKMPILQEILFSSGEVNWEIEKNKLQEIRRQDADVIAVKDFLLQLNANQKLAFNKASRHRISTIQGSPGSGKSKCSAIMIAAWIRLEKGKIVVVCSSNFATDAVMEKLCEGKKKHPVGNIKVLRIFSRKRERKELFGKKEDSNPGVDILHEKVRNHPEYLQSLDPELCSKIQQRGTLELTMEEEDIFEKHLEDIETKILNTYDVFCVTSGVLADWRLQKYSENHPITTVLADECGQVSQPTSLSFFTLNQMRTVLVGDDKQLNACILSYSANTGGLSYSLMRWLRDSPTNIPWTLLSEQYRMTAANCNIISEFMYEGQLSCGAKIGFDPIPGNWKNNLPAPQQAFLSKYFPKATSPTIVINYTLHDCPEKKVGMSFANEKEAVMSSKLCKLLINCSVHATDIGVISYYEGQKSELKKCVPMGVELANVDAFQGREKEIIILNMTRSGTSGIGFASECNRLNVATSRSKGLNFIFLNMQVFGLHASKDIKTFLQLLEKYAYIINPNVLSTKM